jgi:hypothetical protein
MAKTIAILIRAILSISQLLDADFLVRLYKVYEGLLNNAAFPTPPVDMATFKAKIDAYSTSVTGALDGGKAALAERDKQRADVAVMYDQLGHYVEAVCKNDMSTFVSSGFIPAAPKQRSAAQPVETPSVNVKQGVPRQLLAQIKAVGKARHYKLRFIAMPPDGTVPGPTAAWTEAMVPTTRPATPFNDLTPGTIYVFQVQAWGNLGYSAWSDPVSRMCN